MACPPLYINLSVYLSICLFVCVSICLSLSVCRSLPSIVMLPTGSLKSRCKPSLSNFVFLLMLRCASCGTVLLIPAVIMVYLWQADAEQLVQQVPTNNHVHVLFLHFVTTFKNATSSSGVGGAGGTCNCVSNVRVVWFVDSCVRKDV